MTQFKREKIDSITQIDSTQITRESLRFMYGTGQAFTFKNSQGHKISRYRVGVQTVLGDIEVSLWTELVKKLIEQKNDQEIFRQLLEWEKAHNYIDSKTDADLLYDTLKCYTHRIYDNKAWWDYVRFNFKYRPEILENDSDLLLVRLACCGRECRIPKEQKQHNYEAPDTVPCPYCNRSTMFSLLVPQSNNHQYSWSVNDNNVMTVWEDNTILATIEDCCKDGADHFDGSLEKMFLDVVYEIRGIKLDT